VVGEQVLQPSCGALAVRRDAHDRHPPLQHSGPQASHADLAFVVVVFQGGDLHQGRGVRLTGRAGELPQDGLEERRQIAGDGLRAVASAALQADGVDDREVGLLVAGAQFQEQVEGSVEGLVRAGEGAIHLVDHDDDPQAERQRLAQDEAGLGHRAFDSVDEQQRAVDHVEDALDLAAEVGVAGRVDDVDLDPVPGDGGVLGQDGDPALALQGVGVEDAFAGEGAFPEDFGLLEHAVDQRGLAVVNMGNNGDIAEIGAYLSHRGLFGLNPEDWLRPCLAARRSSGDGLCRSHGCLSMTDFGVKLANRGRGAGPPAITLPAGDPEQARRYGRDAYRRSMAAMLRTASAGGKSGGWLFNRASAKSSTMSWY